MAVLVRWLQGAILGCGFCLTTLSALATPSGQVQTPYGSFPLGEISHFQQDLSLNTPKLGRSVPLPPLPNLSPLSREPLQVSFFDQIGRYFETTLESFQNGYFALARDRFYEIIDKKPNSRWAKPSGFWLGLSRTQLGEFKAAVDDLQGWLQTDSEQVPGLRSAAYLTLTWLTARRGDCAESQVWLGRLRDIGQASKEYLQSRPTITRKVF